LDIEVRLEEHGWVVLDSVCIVLSKAGQAVRPQGGFTNLADGVQAPRGPIVVTGTATHSGGRVRAVVLNLGRMPMTRVEVGRDGWRAEIDLRESDEAAPVLTVDALLPNDDWVRLDSARIHLLDGA
jgi:hypothetical protein